MSTCMTVPRKDDTTKATGLAGEMGNAAAYEHKRHIRHTDRNPGLLPTTAAARWSDRHTCHTEQPPSLYAARDG